MKMSPFSCPIFLGHPKASGFCFQSERLLYGREPNGERDGTGKAEAAKLPDAGISPKQWPKKRSGRKRLAYRTQQTIGARGINRRQCLRRKKNRGSVSSDGARWKNCAGASEARSGVGLPAVNSVSR